MDNEKNKYGYSLEEQMAWQSSQNKDLERRGIFDSGAGVNEPEEWLSQKSGPANEENAIDLAILHDWSEKKAVERENLYSEVRKFESEQAKAKKELDAFNKMTSYEKLYDALYHYARYLSKNKNNIKDVEVSKKIVSAMVSAKNGNFDEMENLFAFPELISKVVQGISVETVQTVRCADPDVSIKFFVYAVDGGSQSLFLGNLGIYILMF